MSCPERSIILNADSYKLSMFKQYPPGTKYVYDYVESRGGEYDRTVFFGLQAYIKQNLLSPITQEDIDFAAEFLKQHGEPFDREMWQHILDEHRGYLPLRIRAVPEGSVVGIKNVLLTVENTDPKCFALTTHIETSLLRGVWYPTTVATRSRAIKDIILQYLNDTGTPELIDYKLHDFGARGVSSFDSAGLGGSAHLVNFSGTDTITGILYAQKYYNAGVCGHSIPAAEHSTITSWGRNNEKAAYQNMLNQYAKPGAFVAVVSDSYDVYNACENIWGGDLKQQIIDSGATLVVRPDSGDPEEVVTRVVEILDKKFGHTVNSKGYKVLNYVRVIQGDGVCETAIRSILGHLKVKGYSADNIAFGMGGQLLQALDRDTQRFAMKCSAAFINETWIDVQKDPVTDSGKRSKKGRVTLYKTEAGDFYSDLEKDGVEDALVTVYENGNLLVDYSFDEVRRTANGI